MKDKIRIAAGQGFWGDLPDAPVRQIEGGPIDYLMLDYLAEVTMSIMQKQKARDPAAGYARDFVPLMKQILPACVERDIKVIANAGGVNVEGCAKAVKETVPNPMGWSAIKGELHCDKPHGGNDLLTEQKFTDFELHIEFQAVSMEEEVTSTVPVRFVGESIDAGPAA